MSELVKVRRAAASDAWPAVTELGTRPLRRPPDPIHWFSEYLVTNNPNTAHRDKRMKKNDA